MNYICQDCGLDCSKQEKSGKDTLDWLKGSKSCECRVRCIECNKKRKKTGSNYDMSEYDMSECDQCKEAETGRIKKSIESLVKDFMNQLEIESGRLTEAELKLKFIQFISSYSMEDYYSYLRNS